MAQVNSSIDKNKFDCSLFNTYLADIFLLLLRQRILSQTNTRPTHAKSIVRLQAQRRRICRILAFVNDVHRQVEVKVRLENADDLEHQLVMYDNVKKDEVLFALPSMSTKVS